MKCQSKRDGFVRYCCLVPFAVAILAIVAPGTITAKSLYVIADIHSPCPVRAYDIQPDPNYLVHQTTLNVPYEGIGAVGLTIDAIDVNNAYLFVSYERSNVIKLVDATTMICVGDVNAPDADNLAGIAVDQEKRKLYAVQRNSNHLYVYDWDVNNLTLTLEGGTYKTLDCDEGLYGIALDEDNDLLYIGDSNTIVKYYDTATWTRQGQFTVSHSARGIAIDVPNQYVYTASGGPLGGDLLSKYDLNTHIETVVDVNSTTLGIAVDPATGLVYVTTYGDGSRPDSVLVYDGPNLTGASVPLWQSGDIGNPSGLCVADKDVSYQGAPNGDYGDAPDAINVGFPTRFATTNSRVYAPGVHHLTTGLEMLGVGVSAEDGALDPNDPDGVFNLVDNDANDDGVLGLFSYNAGAPFGVPLSRVVTQVTVTIDANAPAVTRYLNILFDTNNDMQWRDTGFGREWLVVNLEVDTLPGNTETFFVPLGIVPTASLPSMPPHPWLRATLTRTRIDEAATVATGGWDGSGQFEFGETEDYDDLLVLEAPDIAVNLECEKCPLKLLHTQNGTVRVTITVTGSDAPPNSTINFLGCRVNKIGPLTGLGVFNGALPGDIQGAPYVDKGGNPMTIALDITPREHYVGLIQSFSVTFKFSITMGGNTIWSGTKTCGVLIWHPWPDCCWRFGWLNFGGDFVRPINEWIPIPVDGGGEDLAYVMFGNEQPTIGSITIAKSDHHPPGIPESEEAGILPTTSLVSVQFKIDANDPNYIDPNLPEVQTEIIGLRLTGYTDEMIADSGGIAIESMLSPFKMPYYADSFFDIYSELTPDVGKSFDVDDYNNYITIDHPTSFSIWGMRVPQYLVVDDFEPYADSGELRNIWQDGSYNYTTSTVYLETDANLVHEGEQSMEFNYDNSASPYYAEVDANTSDLQVGSDWTIGGAKALTLWLYCLEATGDEPIYVVLEDAENNSEIVLFDGDISDLGETDWYEWNIDLRDFGNGGVNLEQVERIYIGLGNRDYPQPGGSGTICFDDIRLYPPRCIPEYGPAADFTGDCKVNFEDLGYFVSCWLEPTGIPDECDKCDMSPEGGDSEVNFRDFAAMACLWLTEKMFPGSEPECTITCDFNGDGYVTTSDIVFLMSCYGPASGDCAKADEDCDGDVDEDDYGIFMESCWH